ncbi:MAG: ABC transporter permease [Agriterribacter sp.]
MFTNYLKVAIHSLQRNKGFTAINIIGLSIGLAACLLIVFYVADELGYDRYNTNASRIYRADMEVKFGNNANTYAAVQSGFAGEVKKDFTSVEQVVRLRPTYEQPSGFYLKKGNSSLQETSVIYADATLFDVFTLPMLEGNPATALTQPNTAVLTESAAKKYFDRTNIVGQILVLNDSINYKITGVIKDMPQQSHFNYNIFLSMESVPNSRNPNWGGGGYNTYLLLKPGATTAGISKKLGEVAMQAVGSLLSENDYLKYSFTPLTKIHLHSNLQQELGKNGSIQYVYIFSAIAIFILLIACVNFMNLSTARSANRAKEVGVRKVLGSPRKYLVAQFLTESVAVTFASTIIAIAIALLLMPLFNQLSGKELEFSAQTFAWLVPASIALIIIIGFIAGAYPAFFLSRFQPVSVLKGNLSTGFKGGGLRSFLVVFQFSISIFLIIGTLVIYNQLHYIQTSNLGYNRNQVLIIKNTESLNSQAQIFKQQIKQLPGVEDASSSRYTPTGDRSNITALFPDATLNTHASMLTEFWPVDEDYIKTMGMQLQAGRNFSVNTKTDSSAVIINEAAAKFLGFKDPVNKTIYRNSIGEQQFTIIGVIKDFHFKSLRENITPVVLYLSQDRGALNVKVNTANLTNLMSEIKSKWNAVSANQQFEYSFMDAEFDAAYRAEDRIGTIFMAFTILAIAIACLGLFGLSAYAAEQRTKEIGIRKVLGADITTLVGLLSKDFIRLVLIAIVIASPFAWYAMQKWLRDFAYHTDMNAWQIAIAGLSAILIAFATVSFQSIKAALINPVKSLKAE